MFQKHIKAVSLVLVLCLIAVYCSNVFYRKPPRQRYRERGACNALALCSDCVRACVHSSRKARLTKTVSLRPFFGFYLYFIRAVWYN